MRKTPTRTIGASHPVERWPGAQVKAARSAPKGSLDRSGLLPIKAGDSVRDTAPIRALWPLTAGTRLSYYRFCNNKSDSMEDAWKTFALRRWTAGRGRD